MFPIKTYQGQCPTCSTLVFGRSDKVFCSVKCKSQHHFTSKKMQKSVRSEYLRQLARNLNILEGLTSNLGNTVEVHELELNRLGYDITLFTHVRNRIGERQDYLYHFMVKNLGNGRIQLTKTEEKFDHHPIFYRRWEKEFPEGLSVGG